MSLASKRRRTNVVQSITEAFNLGKGTFDEETKRNNTSTLNNNTAPKNDGSSKSPDSSTIHNNSKSRSRGTGSRGTGDKSKGTRTIADSSLLLPGCKGKRLQ